MIRRGLPIFLVLILALSVGGVYAVWTYYDEPIESQDGAMGVNISVFFGPTLSAAYPSD